jgi:hypothetical protein
MDINELYSTPIWKMTGEELAKLISSVIEGKLGRIGVITNLKLGQNAIENWATDDRQS